MSGRERAARAEERAERSTSEHAAEAAEVGGVGWSGPARGAAFSRARADGVSHER